MSANGKDVATWIRRKYVKKLAKDRFIDRGALFADFEEKFEEFMAQPETVS